MNAWTGWNTTLSGQPAGFEAPLFLVAALLAVAGTVFGVRRTRQGTALQGWAAPRLLERLIPGRVPGAQALKVALMGAGLALLAMACARPYWGQVMRTEHRRGVDLAVALDASRSMLAQDVAPSRLAQARVAVESLIDQLHGDRVGLVAFAKDAFVQAPLTTDYGAARLYLHAIDPLQMQQGGTDVGAALHEAAGLLQRAHPGKRQQAVVLLTDGEDWGAGAREEAKALGAAGVKLFTVAVGAADGAPVPALDRRGRIVGEEHDADGNVVITRPNREALAALAQEAGGQSFDLTGDLSVSGLAHAIDALQKGEIEERTVSASAQRYAWFALPALFLMALGLALAPGRKVRSLPGPAVAALAALLLVSRAHAQVPSPSALLHVPAEQEAQGAKAFASGQYDVALQRFRDPHARKDVAAYNQGTALARLGRKEEALKAFSTQSPTLRGRDAYDRGTLLAEEQHQDQAIQSLRQALAADPSNEDARHNLEVLLTPPPPEQKPQPQPQKKDDKPQQAKAGDQKGKPDPTKPGEQKTPAEQAKAEQKGQPDPSKSGDPQAPTQTAQGDAPKPSTPATRMLDSLRGSDLVRPQTPSQPERITADAHPW